MKTENLQKSVLVFQCYQKRLLGHCTDPDLKIGEDWTATLNAIESLLNWAKSITTFFPFTLPLSNTRLISPSSNLDWTIDSIGEQRPSSLTSITYWPTLENSTKPIPPSFALLRPPPNWSWKWYAMLSKFQPITSCSQQILTTAYTVRLHRDIRPKWYPLLRLPIPLKMSSPILVISPIPPNDCQQTKVRVNEDWKEKDDRMQLNWSLCESEKFQPSWVLSRQTRAAPKMKNRLGILCLFSIIIISFLIFLSLFLFWNQSKKTNFRRHDELPHVAQ